MNTDDDTKKRISSYEAKIDALMMAIGREIASQQFYLDLSEKHGDTPVGDIFRLLASEEATHKDRIEEEIAVLQADIKALKNSKKHR
jgi:rubrerythrin